jgi:hypothetical protein
VKGKAGVLGIQQGNKQYGQNDIYDQPDTVSFLHLNSPPQILLSPVVILPGEHENLVNKSLRYCGDNETRYVQNIP